MSKAPREMTEAEAKTYLAREARSNTRHGEACRRILAKLEAPSPQTQEATNE